MKKIYKNLETVEQFLLGCLKSLAAPLGLLGGIVAVLWVAAMFSWLLLGTDLPVPDAFKPKPQPETPAAATASNIAYTQHRPVRMNQPVGKTTSTTPSSPEELLREQLERCRASVQQHIADFRLASDALRNSTVTLQQIDRSVESAHNTVKALLALERKIVRIYDNSQFSADMGEYAKLLLMASQEYRDRARLARDKVTKHGRVWTATWYERQDRFNEAAARHCAFLHTQLFGGQHDDKRFEGELKQMERNVAELRVLDELLVDWEASLGAWPSALLKDRSDLKDFLLSLDETQRIAAEFSSRMDHISEAMESLEKSLDSEPPAAPAGEVAPAVDAIVLPMASLDRAKAAFRANEFATALRLVDRATTEQPNAPDLHEFRALCLFANRRYDQAAAVLQTVMAGGQTWDWPSMARHYASVEVYTEQLRSLERKVGEWPNATGPHYVLGYHYQVTGNSAAAGHQFQTVARLAPRSIPAARTRVASGRTTR